jgi:hypothetical protein
MTSDATVAAPSAPSSAGRRALPVLIGSSATLLAFLSQYVLPRGRILFEIPVWVTPLAVVLGMGCVLAMSAHLGACCSSVAGSAPACC